MTTRLRPGCVLALALGATSPVLAQTAGRDTPPAQQATPKPSTLLATVNGRPITQADLAPAAADIGPELARIPDGKARDASLLDYRIDSVLVAQRALKDGLRPDLASRFTYERNKLLAEALLEKTAQRAIAEPALRRLYADLLKQGALKPLAASGGAAGAPPPFEQVRGELERYAAARAQHDLILELRKTAEIEMFNPPTASTAPSPRAPE